MYLTTTLQSHMQFVGKSCQKWITTFQKPLFTNRLKTITFTYHLFHIPFNYLFYHHATHTHTHIQAIQNSAFSKNTEYLMCIEPLIKLSPNHLPFIKFIHSSSYKHTFISLPYFRLRQISFS